MFSVFVEDDLELRILLQDDAQIFFESIERNRNYLAEFMPRICENRSLKDSQNVICIFLKQLIDNNGFRVGIFYKNKFVGIIGLKHIDWINKKSEIMYWVDEEYTGRQIASKCVRKVMDIAFEYYELNKLILCASKLNFASQGVAKKCGFILDGVIREDELLNSGYCDIFQYSLLRSEYQEIKKGWEGCK